MIKNIYYKDLNGVANANELLKAVKNKGILYTLKEAKEFLAKQETVQVYKKLDDTNLYAPITGDVGTYQADLLFLKEGEEEEQLYPVLVVVEITSRKGYFRSLENKTGPTVAKAFESIIASIKASKQNISIIETDSGSEFKAQEFINVCVRNDIVSRMYPRAENSKTALAKVERLNGTIRMWFNQAFRGRVSPKRAVATIENIYNNRTHSSTGMRPVAVTTKGDYTYLRANDEIKGAKARYTIKKKYYVGLKVRLREPSDIFRKKSEQKWGNTVHTITEQDGYSFKVNDRPETFRAWEMLPIKSVQKIPKRIAKEVQFKEAKANEEEEAIKQKAEAEAEAERKRLEEEIILNQKKAEEEELLNQKKLEEEQRRIEEESNSKKTMSRDVEFPIREYMWIPAKKGKHETLQIRVKWKHLSEEANKQYELQPASIFFLGSKKKPFLNEYFKADLKKHKLFTRFYKAYGIE
jgi:hypothetical protein